MRLDLKRTARSRIVMGMSTPVPLLRSLIATSQLSAAFAFCGLVLFASPLRAQTTTTWTGTTDNQWTMGPNWSNGLPTSSQNTNIQTGSVYLDATGAARTLNLATTTSGSATLFIETGATLSVSSAAQSLIGTGAGATGTVTQTGGSATFNNALTLGGNSSSNGGTASWTISDGSLTVNGAVGLRLGNNTTGNSTSQFTQSGGAVTLTTLRLGSDRYTGATGTPTNTAGYTISGGDLIVSGSFTHGLSTTNGTGRINATTQIIGSTATVSVGGNFILNNNQDNTATLSYSLDNGGVSKINLTGSGTASLAGTLQAGFKGGVALTTTGSFRLIETDTGKISGSFDTGPNAALWSVATSAVSGTRDAVLLSLQGSAQKGALSSSNPDATFAASTTGFVTLADLDVGGPLTLLSLIANAGTGKTITDLVFYFNINNIAAIDTGGGTVQVSWQAQASDSWFAWDLSAFNTDATLSGVSVIPEPSAGTLWIGAGILLLAVRRCWR